MASFLEITGPKWQVGLETDIGGGRENQDECFAWLKKDENIVVLCVLDGHGREVGRIAAEAAKRCLFKHLDENYRDLINDPEDFLVQAHEIAHLYIKASFKTELERLGHQVKESDEGYLLKRKPPAEHWSCIHGGTSCSIIAMIRFKLYIANVGDSSGILCAPYPVLQTKSLIHLMDAANRSYSSTSPSSVSENVQENNESNLDTSTPMVINNSTNSADPSSSSTSSTGTHCLVLTAEHSPESISEYERLLRFRKREVRSYLPTNQIFNNALLDISGEPALVVVYDSSSHDKSKCNPVFERDSVTGKMKLTNRGSYYKNVRKEWASLVSTPPYAKFQDALAFTRSLGDLHLHTYGVTHLPEVQCIDLLPIFQMILKERQLAANPVDQHSSEPKKFPISETTLCVVLATDGVWDNWLYEDVCKFVMDSTCLNAVEASPEGGKRVAMSFMQRNSIHAKRNFGTQADNATGIVLYLSTAENFPFAN